MITPGAFSSINRFKTITVNHPAIQIIEIRCGKRPPSNGTRGRNSGGRTGMTSMIIHSGLFPGTPECLEHLQPFHALLFKAATREAFAFTCNHPTAY